MTRSLAILALTTTVINWITPESSLYLYCSFSMLNLSFVNPNSPSSLWLTAYILWIQQTLTAESEVLHTTLPNRQLTLPLNPKQQNMMKIGCASDWYTAFRDSYVSTIRNKLSLNACNFKYCLSARSQLYPPSRSCKILQHTDNSVPCCHLSYAPTRGAMNYLW